VFYSCALLLGSLPTALGDGPLPKFTFKGVAIHPKDLDYAPTQQLIHPTIIKTEGRIEDPPLKNRYRGAEFYLEGDTLYLYSSASKDPRIVVYAVAEESLP
jgi:hypothetical protein